MPSTAKLHAGSILLTAQGWIPVGPAQSRVAILGADRHGKLVERRVEISSLREHSQVAFLGTPAACISGLPETKILTAEGESVGIGRLAQSGDVRETRFETPFIGTLTPEQSPFQALWSETLRIAAAASEASAAFLCAPGVAPRSVPCGELRAIGKRVYHILSQQDFVDYCMREWPGSVQGIFELWFWSTEESSFYFERSSHLLACWCATALSARRGSCRFEYDSLQHTARIGATAVEQLQPLQRGSCACITPEAIDVMYVEWDDRGWSPVCAGFLLASDTP